MAEGEHHYGGYGVPTPETSLPKIDEEKSSPVKSDEEKSKSDVMDKAKDSVVALGLDFDALIEKIKEALLKEKAPLKLEFFKKLYDEIPVIRNYIDINVGIYNLIKASNCLSYNVLTAAENAAIQFRQKTEPLLNVARTPLTTVDYMLCTSLDAVEQKIPSIVLPPGQLARNTVVFIKDVCTGRVAYNCLVNTCELAKKQLVNCSVACAHFGEKEDSYELQEIAAGKASTSVKEDKEKKVRLRKRLAVQKPEQSKSTEGSD